MSISNASVHPLPVVAEPRSRDAAPLSWSAVLGGLVVALGLWLLLTVLGLAAGLASVDPANPASARHAGLGTGVWSLVVPSLALFAGGVVAARTAGIADRASGALHGTVVWALASLTSVLLLGVVVRGVVSTAVGVTSEAAAAAGAVLGPSGTPADALGRALGLDADTLIGPINERLRAEGKPAVTAEQLEAATKDAVRLSVREGRFDREMLISAIAEHTGLSPRDAREIADDVAARYGALESRLARAEQDAQTGALRAADRTGKALFWLFLSMTLGLGAAVVGSTLGAGRGRGRTARRHVVPLVPREA